MGRGVGVIRHDLDHDGTSLWVEARAPLGTALGLDFRGDAYIHDLAQWDGSSWSRLDEVGLAQPSKSGFRLRYSVDLAGAAQAYDDPDVVEELAGPDSRGRAGHLFTPGFPLLRGQGDLAFRLAPSAGPDVALTSGIPRRGGWHVVSERALPDTAYVAIGTMPTVLREARGASVAATLVGVADSPGLRAWIDSAAAAVAAVYGQFPVAQAQLVVRRRAGGGDNFGLAVGGAGASLLVWLSGPPAAATRNDWVLTHEMMHLGVPRMHPRHGWLTEGIATYGESVARVRAGMRSARGAWLGLAEGLGHGVPRRRLGLDRDQTWGRKYWGGTLFCLMADVALRQATAGRIGFPEALQAGRKAGYSIAVDAGIEEYLEACDKAAGRRGILQEMYAEHGLRASGIDLGALLGWLGVSEAGLDEGAEGAKVRASIMA